MSFKKHTRSQVTISGRPVTEDDDLDSVARSLIRDLGLGEGASLPRIVISRMLLALF